MAKILRAIVTGINGNNSYNATSSSRPKGKEMIYESFNLLPYCHSFPKRCNNFNKNIRAKYKKTAGSSWAFPFVFLRRTLGTSFKRRTRERERESFHEGYLICVFLKVKDVKKCEGCCEFVSPSRLSLER